MRRRPSPETIVTVAVLAGVVLFVFTRLHPGLLFKNNTPAGGDMGAHVWGPAYLRDHLLPHGRLTGWSPDWYAGFPALTFYFPLPSLLIVLLDVVLPYGVAFKLVTVLGVLTLPIAAWAFGRLSGMRSPTPALLGLATVPFLFDRFHTIYGGNILATLAGEFAFSISLSVGLVFLGVFARGLRTGRHRALAAGLLAVTALCHVIPTFFVLGAAGVLVLLRRPERPRLRYAVTSLGTAGLVAGFWVLPFLWRIPYTNDMGWERLTEYRKNLFPFLSPCRPQTGGGCAFGTFPLAETNHLKIVVLLALGGAVGSVLRRQRMGVVLTVMAMLAAAGFRFAPQGRLWNARLLPFWFLCLYLLAAVGVAEGVRAVSALVARRPERPPTWPSLAAPVVAMAGVLLLVALPLGAVPRWTHLRTTDTSPLPAWASWNYSGYEGKAAWPEYRDIVRTMGSVGEREGCGRAMWEYEPDLNRYGTPMALMLLPYWTKGCIGSMEGLFFESSATTPAHFLNQSELSQDPSRAQRNLPYRGLDLAAGIEHLKLMGVRYYMALSPQAIAQAQSRPDLTEVARSDPWRVYRVEGSAVVAPLEYEPAVLTGVGKGARSWLEAAVDLYQDPARFEVPLAASGPKSWPRVAVHHQRGDATIGSKVRLDEAPHRPVRPAKVSRIRTGDDRISFDVDRPGSPVLVKASYFPNWKASGAKGPWRVAPNLMVVVPTSRHVQLHYGRTPVDLAGIGLTLAGLVSVLVMARRGPLEYPEPPSGPTDEDEDEVMRPVEPLGAEPVGVGASSSPDP